MNTRTPRGERRRRQATKNAERLSVIAATRNWLQERAAAAEKRREKAAKKRRKALAKTSRGVDRVPARLRVGRPLPEVIHASTFMGKPYVNPARDAKSLKAGRLRKELRDQEGTR